MGRKTGVFLVVWFVIITAIAGVVYVPLNYWLSYYQSSMPKGIELSALSGHWWRGQAELKIENLDQPAQLSWSATSLFSPLVWHVMHPNILGTGQLGLSLSDTELWVSELHLDVTALNGLLKPHKVELDGGPIQLSNWYARFNRQTHLMDSFNGSADWHQGSVRYAMEDRLVNAKVEEWTLKGETKDLAPLVVLQSKSATSLLEMKLLPSKEVELTVMPEFIESFGQRWPGKKEYPAFVMLQPLPKLR